MRRRELIEAAARLFSEKGYESVAVRDILSEVGGAPGMFYYYFKSKQDIYIAVMEQYLSERLEQRCNILEDVSIPFEEKKAVYQSVVTEDIGGYLERFHPQTRRSIADDSYKLWDFVQMLNKLSKAHGAYLLQGIQAGAISGDLGITEENVEAFSLYTLYGAWGLFYNGKFADSDRDFTLDDVYDVIHKIFFRSS